MGKLGKKARKFAKKNLQTVLKKKRKFKSIIKKKSSSRGAGDIKNEHVEDTNKSSSGRIYEGESIKDTSLDAIYSEDYKYLVDGGSESDEFLSEDSSWDHIAQIECKKSLKDSKGVNLSVEKTRISSNLAKQKKKLDRLKKKNTDEIETEVTGKLLTNTIINSWFQLVKERKDIPAFTSLINGYRVACHHGTDPASAFNDTSSYRLQNGDAFSNMIFSMLQVADNTFRGMLGISSSSFRKEIILDMKNSQKWKTAKPLIKSYIRSTLFVLDQVTDSEILTFALSRLRASIVLFAGFPSLLQRLIEIAVRLWATRGDNLSSCSFLIIRDVAVVFDSDFFDTCFIKMYKAFVAQSNIVNPMFLEHLHFLRKSFVELCSLDILKSSSKIMLSIEQLAKIVQQAFHTKKKETMNKICSWQYISCIEVWVMFISANIGDCDLQPLLFMMIQIVNGVAHLFPGPRYFPLRLKCVQWLNDLSRSSRIFIPVASFVLDALEYKIVKEGGKLEKAFGMSTSIKLPKHFMRSRDFQQECVVSAMELLSFHFSQWSYHVSFPELATIPLIRLKKFYETTTIEGFRRLVKRFIDQVEQNIEFVRKKRDEVAFSPKDLQAVESFLQLEKSSGHHPFTQYYKSIISKAEARRNTIVDESKGLSDETKPKKRKEYTDDQDNNIQNGEVDTKKPTADSFDNRTKSSNNTEIKNMMYNFVSDHHFEIIVVWNRL